MPTPRYVLIGRIVTMDDARTVLDDGALEVDGGTIAGVRPASEPAPEGWEDVPRIRVHGTVFPGLIELHNHLSYDALPLWQVPGRYADREQWGGGGVPEYRKLVTGPMSVLGSRENLLGPLARYVECKALLGGTTTSQGLGLAAAGGTVRRFYRGLVRNVEDTGEPVAARRHEPHRRRPRRRGRRLPRPAEATAPPAATPRRGHQRTRPPALPGPASRRRPLGAGPHADRHPRHRADRGRLRGARGARRRHRLVPAVEPAALRRDRRRRGGAGAGVRIALGGDWSPSGSKNLLGELKAARAAAPATGAGRRPGRDGDAHPRRAAGLGGLARRARGGRTGGPAGRRRRPDGHSPTPTAPCSRHRSTTSVW